MPTNKKLRIRIDPKSKEEFRRITKRIGLTMSAAIKTFIHRTIINNGLDFQPKTRRLTKAEEQKLNHTQMLEYIESLTDED